MFFEPDMLALYLVFASILLSKRIVLAASVL